MTKSQATDRMAANGRFSSKPLGKGKAMRFALVEGLVLSSGSAKTISQFEDSGLKGDALRSAIAGSFMQKQQ